ncbi:hypothetical protein Q4589_16060 [Cobetia marina]|jgi:hypothetical protein|uniref:hypothetical protein n=1 Tax=Cobetia TaxID=204286 RepID=UPI001969B58C|nr:MULTISPECIES: hypothetical protein [Cobetia]MDH2292170.1 hypothetical protein [Cobetia sp. 10Alg 146]MDH2374562.1 hypothetical protein [Cobetia sp. 3AK]MDN2657261.1 hypothetical protein [Cobetia sp. 14N.309.X.WAT.E.A4]MDO6789098.1 hypothetical protein [Cobetia marina]
MKSMIFQSGMWLRNGIAAAGMTLMLASPAYAIELPSEQGDDTPSAGMMVADALVGRPLLLATTVVGAALFVVSAPFAAMGQNIDETARVLVATPAQATFARCLGCKTTRVDWD